MLAAGISCVACEPGCGESHPYQLRLHVERKSDCHAYEGIVAQAVEIWSTHGVDAFEYEGCDIHQFAADPIFSWSPGEIAYTDDLMLYNDHVPIYVVEWILLDQDGSISELRGATIPSETVGCPGLIAVDLANVGLMAHEFGHLLWLGHDDTYSNVMYPSQWPKDTDGITVRRDQVEEAIYNFDLCNRRTQQ